MANGTKTATQWYISAPSEKEVFTANAKTYAILRLPLGLTFGQTINAIEDMKAKGWEMLTLKKAREIRDNTELSSIFKDKMQPGEWAFVRPPGLASAYIYHGGIDHMLHVCVEAHLDHFCKVVILEKISNETAASQNQTKISKLLRQADLTEDALSRLSGSLGDREAVLKLVEMVRVSEENK